MNSNDLHQYGLDEFFRAATGKCSGIAIAAATAQDAGAALRQFREMMELLGLAQHVETELAGENGNHAAIFRLSEECTATWAANSDTLQLCQQLNLDTHGNPCDLEREIALAMLMSPVSFQFPSYQELTSALRIRKNIVVNARKTALSFSTDAAERPAEYWTYHAASGFTLLPGKLLIGALQQATQPDESGKRYSFSCYRATEYIILLSIAQELSQCNPGLYQQLQGQWEKQAIMSGKFHDVFLHEYGSMEQPLPPGYYVPGDRLWFRNPDEPSSDATGYEGSWVFYLGNGQFTNFWKRAEPYTLMSKCVEIYHWRNATYRDAAGTLQVDEKMVEKLVQQSLSDPEQTARILKEMLRLREPKGVYVAGGCIDTSREYPRRVCPGTSDIVLPLMF